MDDQSGRSGEGVIWGTSMFVICYAVIMPLFHSPGHMPGLGTTVVGVYLCAVMCGVWVRTTEQTLPLRQSFTAVDLFS